VLLGKIGLYAAWIKIILLSGLNGQKSKANQAKLLNIGRLMVAQLVFMQFFI
jgi:hypothetical protein